MPREGFKCQPMPRHKRKQRRAESREALFLYLISEEDFLNDTITALHHGFKSP